MFRDHLGSIEGVEVYAIIAMMIFITFFAGIIIWMIKADKQYIKKMRELPLENEMDISISEAPVNNFNKKI